MSASVEVMLKDKVLKELTLFSHDPSQVAKAVNLLVGANCCPRCTFRFLGEKDQDLYRDHTIEELTNKLRTLSSAAEEEEVIADITKEQSPCSACLGVLQDDFSSDTFLQTIQQKITEDGFQFEDFLCSLTLPVTMLIRQHSLWCMLMAGVSSMYEHEEADDISPIKDVWKWINGPALVALLKVPFDLKSGFHIGIVFNHPQIDEECNFLLELYPDIFRKRKFGKLTKKYGLEVFNRTNVTKALEDTSMETFRKYSRCPPKQLQLTCQCSSIRLYHSALYIAGRYNKYSRTLSQTPWIIDGKRKTQTSVQELICEKLLEDIKPDDHRFSSSGREDVDVRMLGRGRPFVVEFLNPRRVNFTPLEMANIQKEINASAKDLILTRDLQKVTKEDTSVLKEGEEDKTKAYRSLCWSATPITQQQLDTLNDKKDIVLQQKTPIRVLHRRPLLVRSRTVHSLETQLIDDHHFELKLVTQAGTYVKEFVHGDFGRTIPNMSTLLGQECDILELDVQAVNVNWPKRIDEDDDQDTVSMQTS